MKIFILKLLSLTVLVLGLVSLLVVLGVPQVREYWDMVPEYLTVAQKSVPEPLAFLRGALTVQGLWFGGSVVAIVLGVYGFFPKLSKYRRRKKIAYEGPHGEVQIQLDSVEQSLNQVLARMPEIKKIDLRVDPQDGGRKALIRADVVLNQQPGQNARAIAALVSDYIAETSTKLLGLEELANIDLNVVGINVNTRKSSKAIRKESLSHSGNAPVELLEAAPAPLSLSGPNTDPIGSESIEEELDEEAENERAMEADAVDTKKEEAKQAAARSELLEPLNMGESRADAMAQEPEAPHETPEAEEAPEAAEEPLSPLDMDVLDESLEDEGAEEAPEYDTPEVSETPAFDASEEDEAKDGFVEEAVEAVTGDTAEEQSEGFIPESESAEASESEEPSVENEDENEPASPSYPWEQNASSESEETPAEEAQAADSEPGDESAGATVPDTTGYGDTDSVMGDAPGEVTIPEANEEEPAAEETDKKRWGSWFN